MSVDVQSIIDSQQEIVGRMARSMVNLRKMGEANITLNAVETRLKILEQLWTKFEKQHDYIRASMKEHYKESEYARNDICDEAENTYAMQRSALLECAATFKADSKPSSIGSDPTQKTSLPRMKLPQFSGSYDDWPSFRDLFLSVIGENATLSKVERLHYLRSCVHGPAEKLIRSLTVTNDNYERAWTTLNNHYENKRELIRSNFATFTAVPKMKGETADELYRILNAVTTAVNAQESINRPINSHGMDLFNYLVVELFDSGTRLEWESSTSDLSEPADHKTLVSFMTRRILTLNAANPKGATKTASNSTRNVKAHLGKQFSEPPQCPLCKGKHSLMLCSDFKDKSAKDRRTFVETNKRCFNCLGNHQVARCQSSRNCLSCNARHNSMLHDAYVQEKTADASVLSAVRHTDNRKATLLATARVMVADRYGEPHAVRALIDQGSEVSIISEALVQQLRLPRSRTTVTIVGIGGAHSGSTKGKVALDITSQITGAHLAVIAFVLPRLTLYQGSSARHGHNWAHIQGLPLADPQFADQDKIELLLGAEICATILEEGLRRGEPRMPIAQKTSLGWILSGGSEISALQGHCRSLQCTIDDELAKLVQLFWEQEKAPAAPAALTPDEERCENFFVRTHKRTTTGRYMVRLPFATAPTSLMETRTPAERLLLTMERKGKRDPQFGELYRTFMTEYANLQHMEISAPVNSTQVNYLPHHGVLRESSSTTKLRVVFNGSQRTRTGESLNSHLLIGANRLPALSDVLMRWRWHRYVFVTDIEKMYRQILVHPEDRDWQRILWRAEASLHVREYRLNTVTYGLACAPFLAIRTLHQLACDEEARYPQGAASLRRDCYVDDIVTGAGTLHDANALVRELRELCMAGGFPLRKWATNCPSILSDLPVEHLSPSTQHTWQSNEHLTLGLRWQPAEDTFSIQYHSRVVTTFTKRSVLSETARLFDPLGWLAPVTVRAKILIQSAWLRNLDWDSPLPAAEVQLWRSLLEELPLLSRVRLHRWLGTGDPSTTNEVEIHGFADASERAYAAAVYLRVRHSDTITVHLLAAKSKVSPVRPVSMPRLELCAAALLSCLAHHVRDTLHLSTAPIYLWSDSTVTLHWIQGHASRWKTFVANRVSLIQERLPEAQWRHIAGLHNPADCASRGITPSELIEHPLWWTGPPWLTNDKEAWPSSQCPEAPEKLPESRSATHSTTTKAVSEPDMLLRFPTLQRLLRVTAWCMRWRRPRTHPPLTDAGSIQPDELDSALYKWLRLLQELHFTTEFTAVSRGRMVSTRSSLARLSLFLDERGVLRVGGRLKHATLSSDERHPLIVPPSSWIAKLIVDSCHRRSLHGGVQLTLGLLRLRYWLPRGRAIVKHWLHRCVTCTRWRGSTPQPPMGNLPPGRVTPTRPFLRTGVDYAGPISIRTTGGRGYKARKAFIAVFVCLCTRATHLEVVSDYTTEAFLAAFRRFTSRRGLCEAVFSDCGTNFVGADRELRGMFRASTHAGRSIACAVNAQGIRWHFNPPAAPHFGGLWEAAVKSAKHHLRRVIGDSTLTFEEMSTFLAQVESCLNSRPLQALSDDPDDISALTPGHFLIGAPLLAVPEPSRTKDKESTLSRWHRIQAMRDHFWQRWSREYIHGLIAKPKWNRHSVAPQVGDLCLVRLETTPPSRWPLARIIRLHPGDDGITRVVTVKTAKSELVRPIVQIVPLPGTQADSIGA